MVLNSDRNANERDFVKTLCLCPERGSHWRGLSAQAGAFLLLGEIMKQKIVPLLILIVIFLVGCKKNTSPVEPQSNTPEKLILNLADTSATGNYILRWTSSKEANSYTVQEDIDPPFNNASTVYLGTDTTFRISGKPFGRIFYYRVRGNNTIGSGDWSDTKRIVVYQKPAPNIVVSTTSVDFGDVFANSSWVDQLAIQNSGNDTLQITNFVLRNTAFAVDNFPPLKISPNNWGYAQIRFHPTMSGIYTDSLVVESNDIDDYPPKIYLSGKAENLPSANQERILAGTGNGVYLSLDSGASWQAVGLQQKWVWSFAISGTNVFAGTSGYGVFLSIDNGITWQAVNSGLTHSVVFSLAVSGSNVFAGTRNTDASGTSPDSGVYVSTDNGTTWKGASSGLTNHTVRALAVIDTNLFAGTDGDGVFRSTDAGVSWQAVNSGLTSPGYKGIQTLAVSGSKIFAGTRWGLFMSSNNGTSWTQTASTNTEVFALAASGPNVFASTNGDGVFRSTNNGITWQAVNSGLTHSVVLSLAVNGSDVFAGTEGDGVFRSTDGGESWTRMNNVLAHAGVYSLIISN
jgi:photosystem II stability/assembly factor-like uncharacterized protein